MARPIKETPILQGKAADSFLREIGKKSKVSASNAARIKENYEKLKSISQF